MNIKELLTNRFSVRSYLSKTVETDKLEYILECVRLSPSACNLQPWKFFVVQKSETVKAGIREAYNREWFAKAPAYIVAVGDHAQSWKRSDGKDACDIDVSIAAEHICLAAEELGLGTCWVCNFDVKKIAETLSLKEMEEPMALFPIGYPNSEAIAVPEKKRKSLEKITGWL